jgi:catechol 2,3-dioxygenase-like lactoylglutathione lyase family enzyme
MTTPSPSHANQAPAIRCMSHLTMSVRDLDVAEQFYVGVLGATITHRMDLATFTRDRPGRVAELDVANSPLHIALKFGDEDRFELQLFLQTWPAQPVDQAHPHFAMRVHPADLLAFKHRLEHHAIPVDGPRRLGPPGHASLYFFDPFGNHLELESTGFTGEVAFGPPDQAKLPYAWTPRTAATTASSASIG